MTECSAVSLSGYKIYLFILCYFISFVFPITLRERNGVKCLSESERERARAHALPYSNRFSDLVEIANDLIAHVIESEQLH